MIARMNFAHLPTPVEELPRLSAALGGPRLLVKRDDQTGLAFGGNKTRKLEFLVAEARAQGARTLISAGALQSNHCRQTAAAAARFGFECILVLTGDVQVNPSANLLLDQLFGGADRCGGRPRRPRQDPAGDIRQGFGRWSAALPRPLWRIKPDRCVGVCFRRGRVHQAGYSGGLDRVRDIFRRYTCGLVLGQRHFGFRGSVLGISIDESEEWLKARVSALASDTSEKLGHRIDFTPQDVMATDKYCRAGYGVLTDAEREAVRLFARCEGLLLDPVYTGRAAAGLIDLIRKGFFKKDETVLFWHTGGQPALFAERYSDIYKSPQ